MSRANDRCCVTSTLWGLLSRCSEDPRPLSNPHYMWANVGNEDVRVIKHHHGPSLYRKRNTLSGIVLHLKDKWIGQRISSILVTVPYWAPCARQWRQFAARPLDGSLGVPQLSAVSASLVFSRCVAFSPLGSIHWRLLTKWTTKKGYLAAHYAVPWRRINEYDLCLIVTCATSLALYSFRNGGWVYKGSINPVPRKWRKERGRVLIKPNKARICTTFWVTFEFSWGFLTKCGVKKTKSSGTYMVNDQMTFTVLINEPCSFSTLISYNFSDVTSTRPCYWQQEYCNLQQKTNTTTKYSLIS